MEPFEENSDLVFEKAKTAALILAACCEELTPVLLRALVSEESTESNNELIAPLSLEMFMFGLHLTDRIAFDRLGPTNRTLFMNALLERVQNKLKPPLDSQLHSFYNLRIVFYARFPKLFADKDDNLKDTLFWEFGKALSAIYAFNNPVAIVKASTVGMEFLGALNQAFDAANVI